LQRRARGRLHPALIAAAAPSVAGASGNKLRGPTLLGRGSDLPDTTPSRSHATKTLN
jgi:hypothetical protein